MNARRKAQHDRIEKGTPPVVQVPGEARPRGPWPSAREAMEWALRSRLGASPGAGGPGYPPLEKMRRSHVRPWVEGEKTRKVT